MSFLTSQFSKFTSDLRSYYPPFLSMLLVNCFNTINMLFISYFFNGVTFDFDSFWGIFSIINDSHFTSFMYMAIVLLFGQLISALLVTRMFPDPIIPAIAMTLEPFLASFIVDLGGIQSLPGNYSMIGFILIFPGMMLVIMGQCFYQRQKSIQ